MLTAEGIQSLAVVVYGSAAVGLFGFSRYQPEELRKYCYLLAGVVTLSAVGSAMSVLGVGTVSIGGLDIQVFDFADDVFAYPVVFGLAALVAGASRKMIGLLAGLSALSLIIAQFGLGIAGVGAMVLTYLARVYLLYGPVTRAARSMPNERRLLFRKFRDLLVFLMGFVFVGIVMSVAGLLDAFTFGFLLEYINVLLRVGFAGFLISNIGVFAGVSDGLEFPGREATA